MADRPILIFPSYSEVEREGLTGRGSKFQYPSFERQKERISPKMDRLSRAMEERRAAFQQTPSGLQPEYALVIETIGSVDRFYNAIKRISKNIEGFEWLFEADISDVPNDDDFYLIDEDGEPRDHNLSGKLYCVMTDQRALQELLSLWNHFKNNPDYNFPYGLKSFKNIFESLKDIRPWGYEERFEETGILEVWEEELTNPDIDKVNAEIEFFFRNSSAKREQIYQEITQLIDSIGGRVLSNNCAIAEIGYHAISAELPRDEVQKILNHDMVNIAKADNIMFFRPCGQIIILRSQESIENDLEIELPENILEEPIVALFDGLPQNNHELLDKHLLIDDPDDISRNYSINDRVHGTAMASLIIHGDLTDLKGSIDRKIYARPIMKPFGQSGEFVPPEILLVDEVHRFVRRLFEESDGAVAKTVKVINFSIGDPCRQFINTMSPLARLMDWLSFKYNVLFVVSAGNTNLSGIDLGITFEEFSTLSKEEQTEIIIKRYNESSRNSRILSPAESMNSLTVGAIFNDSSDFNLLPNQIMIFENNMLPSIFSCSGRGYRNSIKPDIYYSGGKRRMKANVLNRRVLESVETANVAPGNLTAAPYNIREGGERISFSHGTSNSAALISYNANKIFKIVNDIFTENGNEIPNTYSSLILKAMLVHGSTWENTSHEKIKSALQIAGRGDDVLHRYIGYGMPDISMVEDCTERRITLFGYGELGNDEAHLYSLPIPLNFSRSRIYRKATITLAYYSPIIATRQKYRTTQLWFSLVNLSETLTPSRLEANWQAVKRGTLQHEIFEGEDTIGWPENSTYDIKVNCREDAHKFDGKVKYCIAVSFEVAEGITEDIYLDIKNAIEIREHVQIRQPN